MPPKGAERGRFLNIKNQSANPTQMNTPDENQQFEDMARIQTAVEGLGEHFDTVQIFVTRVEHDGNDGMTMNANWGTGNWFARKGQVQDWLTKIDERVREEMREEE
jgi:hypothetical protein